MVNAGAALSRCWNGRRSAPQRRLFFPQPSTLILEVPAQAGYGDKRTS